MSRAGRQMLWDRTDRIRGDGVRRPPLRPVGFWGAAAAP